MTHHSLKDAAAKHIDGQGHGRRMKAESSDFFSRYYPTPDGDRLPFAVRSLGFNCCGAEFVFSEMLRKHPADHRFSAKGGRVRDTVTLVHITRGCGRFSSAPSGDRDVPTNSVFVVFPGVHHSYRYDENTGWDEEWVELDPEFALPLLARAGITPESPVRQFRAQPMLSGRYRALFELARSPRRGTSSRLAAAAYAVLAEVTSVWTDGVAGARPQRADKAVETLRSYLTGNDANPMCVAEASRICGMSASRLRSLFRSYTGLSPKQYQLRTRIVRCCRMLEKTRLPVAAIAVDNGFASPAVFSRQFQRMMGMTPTDYRAKTAPS